MKRIIKIIKKIIAAIVTILFIILTVTSVFHRYKLSQESSLINPIGQFVDVGGYKMHVYSLGNKLNSPTLLLMSGSATVAPVYDFKQLYTELASSFNIVVVEKPGYGYSDITSGDRDVKTMVNEVRAALNLSGLHGPYVLLPHSMSGLEAIYWAQNYPKEVTAIIGLDMATPQGYETFDYSKMSTSINLGRAAVFFGLHRIPSLYPLFEADLDNFERNQQRLLMYRNAVNDVYIRESKWISRNASKVMSGNRIELPLLLITSNGKETGADWITAQESFASENGGQILKLDTGHYLHYAKSHELLDIITRFINSIDP